MKVKASVELMDAPKMCQMKEANRYQYIKKEVIRANINMINDEQNYKEASHVCVTFVNLGESTSFCFMTHPL